MSDWNIEEAIIRTGVLMEGHFLLSSGNHSPKYLQCAKLLQHPQEAEAAGKAIAALFRDVRIDVVVGPALGGVIIAHEVARALGTRCIFAERKEGKMQIRRDFNIKSGEFVLIIEDVVTTGGSVKEVIKLVEESEGKIVGVGSIVDRSKELPFPYVYRALTDINIETYPAETCRLCMKDIPLKQMGSRTDTGMI